VDGSGAFRWDLLAADPSLVGVERFDAQ